MNVWNWVKSFGWVKTLGLVLGAIALALAAGRASSKHKAGVKKEKKAENLLNASTSREIQKGKKLVEAADKDKTKAADARKKMEAHLEKLGEANEDMDSIADRFNSRRLRVKSTSTGT